MKPSNVSLGKQAITGSDNATVDPSMLALMFTIFVLLPSAIGILAALSFVDVYVNKHEFNATVFGSGLAAMLAGVCIQVLALVRMLRIDREVPDGLPPPAPPAP